MQQQSLLRLFTEYYYLLSSCVCSKSVNRVSYSQEHQWIMAAFSPSASRVGKRRILFSSQESIFEPPLKFALKDRETLHGDKQVLAFLDINEGRSLESLKANRSLAATLGAHLRAYHSTTHITSREADVTCPRDQSQEPSPMLVGESGSECCTHYSAKFRLSYMGIASGSVDSADVEMETADDTGDTTHHNKHIESSKISSVSIKRPGLKDDQCFTDKPKEGVSRGFTEYDNTKLVPVVSQDCDEVMTMSRSESWRALRRRSMSAEGYDPGVIQERRASAQALFDSVPDLTDEEEYKRWSELRKQRRGAVCYDIDHAMMLIQNLHLDVTKT